MNKFFSHTQESFTEGGVVSLSLKKSDIFYIDSMRDEKIV